VGVVKFGKNTNFESNSQRLFEIDGGSMKIVVEEYSITQATHTNRQAVAIKAVSDWDYTIFYEEN
jgi:hypothetical protein